MSLYKTVDVQAPVPTDKKTGLKARRTAASRLGGAKKDNLL